jgi:hypothetical protein
MSQAGTARLTVVTLGVRDIAASARFYEALGFVRKFRATGDEIAFFEAGGVVLALWDRDKLAADAVLPVAVAQPDRFHDVTWPGTARRPPRSMQPSSERWMREQSRCVGRSRPITAATAAISPILMDTPGRWCRRRALRSPKTAG